VNQLQEELEELFADLWQVPGFAGLRRGFRPHVDCYRSEEPPAVTIVVDLAGIEPDGVEVAVTERTVVINGVRRRPKLACAASGSTFSASESRRANGPYSISICR
jgi:HSP20 family molecular chaperone IbpA